MLHLITIHTNFVTPDDGLQSILLAEPLRDVWTELKTDSSLAGSATRLILRIGPQHLHHETRLARLSLVMSIELADVVQGDVVVGEEATMEDKILLADQCRQRQGREAFREQLENPGINRR